MKRFASYFLYTLLLAAVACACSGCSDDLDIRRDYLYCVETLPLPKSLKKRRNGRTRIFDCPRRKLCRNDLQISVLPKRRRRNVDQ